MDPMIADKLAATRAALGTVEHHATTGNLTFATVAAIKASWAAAELLAAVAAAYGRKQ